MAGDACLFLSSFASPLPFRPLGRAPSPSFLAFFLFSFSTVGFRPFLTVKTEFLSSHQVSIRKNSISTQAGKGRDEKRAGRERASTNTRKKIVRKRRRFFVRRRCSGVAVGRKRRNQRKPAEEEVKTPTCRPPLSGESNAISLTHSLSAYQRQKEVRRERSTSKKKTSSAAACALLFFLSPPPALSRNSINAPRRRLPPSASRRSSCWSPGSSSKPGRCPCRGSCASPGAASGPVLRGAALFEEEKKT